ncbi:MAG: GH3 auxin-responsive promoter family protein [Nitrososphaerales archaeon]
MDEKTLYEQTCSFFEKSFSRQLEFNQTQLQEHLRRWQQTITSKRIASTINSVTDIPLTTYADYPEMSEFGMRLQEMLLQNPRRKDELLADYYCRIARQLTSKLSNVLPYNLGFVVKTTGSTGPSKWLAHGEVFWENFRLDSLALGILACSENWGASKFRIGERVLNVVAPAPYLSGWAMKAVIPYCQLVPPLEISDNISDVRQKFYFALRVIEKGEKITLGGANAATLYMLYRYLADRENFFRDLYNSVEWGTIKLYFLYQLLKSYFASSKPNDVFARLPLKGAAVGGADTKVYSEFFKNTFGIVPLNLYGSSEGGVNMLGTPDDRLNLMPNLRSSYYEFLDYEKGEVLSLEEVKKDRLYELVITPFGSALARYRTGDLFRLIKVKDDGMPIFSCEGRAHTVIDVYGYFRLTEGLITEALILAGLKNSDKWAVIKQMMPNEHLHFLMEKTWDYSEKEAEKQIFKALSTVSTDFAAYVDIFGIKDPSKLIKVEYLKQGAFTRYYMYASKAGLPLGQLKAPKIIPTDRLDIFELLKRV